MPSAAFQLTLVFFGQELDISRPGSTSWVDLALLIASTWQVNRCLSIKGAEDVLNKPHAFEISTVDNNMFFIADSDKVRALCPLKLCTFEDCLCSEL